MAVTETKPLKDSKTPNSLPRISIAAHPSTFPLNLVGLFFSAVCIPQGPIPLAYIIVKPTLTQAALISRQKTNSSSHTTQSNPCSCKYHGYLSKHFMYLHAGGAIIHPNLSHVNKKIQHIKNGDYILPHLNVKGEEKKNQEEDSGKCSSGSYHPKLIK